MRRNEQVAALRRVPLFADLSDRELGQVAKDFHEVVFNAGDVIVAEGGAGGPFFLIAEGRAKVVINGRARRTYGPGEAFGEIALIDQGPRSATIVAETHVRAFAIPSWSFLALLEGNWKLAHKVMKGLCKRIREMDKAL